MQISKMIKEGVELIEDDKEKKIGVYYPSELGYCERKLYYSYFEPPQYSLETRKLFSIGIAFHTLLQRGLEFYSKKHPEIQVKNEPEDVDRIYKAKDFELHGRMDSMIISKSGIDIIEIKSHNNLNFLRNPYPHHLLQLNYYLHFYPQGHGHMFYINKAKRIPSMIYEEYREYPRANEHTIMYDEDLFTRLVKRAEKLHSHLVKKELPQPEAYLKSSWEGWECKSCPANFKQKCQDDILKKTIGEENFSKIGKGVKP